ncbi:MAG: NAD-dependent protein deacylase, partial [Desulfovibrionales bacterium]|nr:NAD-dependent protein deacylase [Desulfovibrionales bacterium]
MDMEKSLKHARPNKGHQAIARLDRLGLVRAVITQNIDGLHQASGILDKAIIELHGNTRRVRCMSCGNQVPWKQAEAKINQGDPAPECHCGGYLKPDTVSFGQAMPEEAVQRAVELARQSDLFLVVGSTLLVQPAALMPVYARENGAFLSIVNLSATPMDNECDLLITAGAGPVLERVVKRLFTN